MKPSFLSALMFCLSTGLPLFGSLWTGAALAEKAPPEPHQKPLKISEKAMEQILALQQEKALWTPAQRKLDSQFMYAPELMAGGPLADRVPGLRVRLEIRSDNTTLVDIKARVTPSLLAEIGILGGTVVTSLEDYDAVRARMPLTQLEPLAEHPDVWFIRPAAKAISNKINTSEGDPAHNGPLARTNFGVDGTGVKIGVLSDSVSYLAHVQATGDLPGVTVLEDFPGITGEGTALLEVVHDLAPGADLYFATAWTSMESFAANILALRAAGCHVLVDDITYLIESPFQDDVISQAVNAVTADGALYFSSAGNSGSLNHGRSGVWEGDFAGVTDGSLPEGLGIMEVHDFGGGHTTNAMTTDPPYAVMLFWSDPLGGSGNDYDLYLLNPGGDQVWAFSINAQDGDDDPLEAIDSGMWNDKDNLLVVCKYRGDDRFIHLNTNRGRLEHGTAGQIKGHHAAADAFGVAAVDARQRTAPFNGSEVVEGFSSDGPRRVFYYPDGTPITAGDVSSTGGQVRQKPDMAAADGVATATPWFNPFYGTSAAAAHGAGIAALLLSLDPFLTPEDARTTLTRSALDIEEPGWDRDSGAGIVMADRALSYDDLFVTPLEGFGSSGPEGGPFKPGSKEYTLKNTTDRPLWWRASHRSRWMAFSSPPFGLLYPGESTVFALFMDHYGEDLKQGVYRDAVRFANITEGSSLHGYVTVTREVTLRVSHGKSQPEIPLLLP